MLTELLMLKAVNYAENHQILEAKETFLEI
jgi:hypothetical protein